MYENMTRNLLNMTSDLLKYHILSNLYLMYHLYPLIYLHALSNQVNYHNETLKTKLKYDVNMTTIYKHVNTKFKYFYIGMGINNVIVLIQ